MWNIAGLVEIRLSLSTLQYSNETRVIALRVWPPLPIQEIPT